MLYRAHTYYSELFKFHDFFHDLFKFSMTVYIGLAVTFQNFQNFPCSRVFFGLTQLNRHELCRCPPKCKLFTLFNFLSLFYIEIVLLHISTASNLPDITFIFHDFPRPTIKFHDYPGLENVILAFHDFPGFPWPVQTLLYM